MSVTRLNNPRRASAASIVSAAGAYVHDADAAAYIAAVEAADGQRLEQAVRNAIAQFVIGLKTDGLWAPIKFACILMGARTLSGALTPLVGSAPTNVNFVSGDYARGGATPGLLGGSTKYINSNRANNADGRDDCHAFAFMTALPTAGSGAQGIFGASYFGNTDRFLTMVNISQAFGSANNNAVTGISTNSVNTGGWGVARNGSTSWNTRCGFTKLSRTEASNAPASANVMFMASGTSPHGTTRCSFISLGAYLDTDVLSARAATLTNAISAALP